MDSTARGKDVVNGALRRSREALIANCVGYIDEWRKVANDNRLAMMRATSAREATKWRDSAQRCEGIIGAFERLLVMHITMCE